MIDGAAARARATPYGAALFPASPLDPAHGHSPALDSFEAPWQAPTDPELGGNGQLPAPGIAACPWLEREFEATLIDVNRRITLAGPDDPLVSLRGLLSRIDRLSEGASQEQLEQSRALLDVELGRRGKVEPQVSDWVRDTGIGTGGRLVPLEQLFDNFLLSGRAQVQEIGGRSL